MQGCLVQKWQRMSGEVPYTTEDEILGQLSSHFAQRFRLAFSAPCHNGQLFSDIGFLGDTAAAQAILEGRYEFPDDTDPATRLLSEKAGYTYARMSRTEVATYVRRSTIYHRRRNFGPIELSFCTTI